MIILSGCSAGRQELSAASTAGAEIGSQDESSAEKTVQTTRTTSSASSEASSAADTTVPANGMIFPESDTSLIMWKDLIVLSPEDLAFARNDFYARGGYAFVQQKYIDRYAKMSWYKINSDFSQDNFTEIQWANITLIQTAEKYKAGELMLIPSGTKLDYDQDGSLEILSYSSADEWHMSLVLQDGAETENWDILCEQPTGNMYLGDIDSTDGVLDLFADEFGPSDDLQSYVSAVRTNGLLQRDTIPGTGPSLIVDGSGFISTERRMQILMTWYAKVRYGLNGAGKLVFVPQDSYSMDNFACSTKTDIPLRTTNDSAGTVAFVVPAGTSVNLVSTDNIAWIEISTPAGTGWLQMVNGYTLADPNITAYDAFEGLIIAD